MPAPATLAVVGLGLIGGSFALGARRAGLFSRIIGVDANPDHASAALARGLCDEIAAVVPAHADAVLVAVPSDAVPAVLASLASHPGLVFDVASVKGAMLERAATRPERYLPAHPIAGSERSGPEAARDVLFADHLVVLTPLVGNTQADIEQLSHWWQALGARVEQMTPEAHDALFARTSHLPHLVAFAYMQLIGAEQLRYAAGGFRDFSRIAGADPDMWTPIFRLNRDALSAELEALRAQLDRFEAALGEGSPAVLEGLLAEAQTRRRAFESIGTPTAAAGPADAEE